MSFIKATIVGVDFKDLQHPPTTDHIHADVVLVDRSPPEAIPSIYYLKEGELDPATGLYQSHGYSQLTEDSFSMIGTVLSIDKEKKIIRLRNEKAPEVEGSLAIVSYNHIIIASDLNHALLGATSRDEFTAGLTALLDALKLRKNVPEQFSALQQDLKASTRKRRQFHSSSQEPIGLYSKSLDALVQSHLSKESLAEIPSNLASFYKRLYEVQIGS